MEVVHLLILSAGHRPMRCYHYTCLKQTYLLSLAPRVKAMIYRLSIVPVFVCCLINHPVKASSLDTGVRTKQIDTLLVDVHQSKIDAAASNTNTLAPPSGKIPVRASHNVLNHHKNLSCKKQAAKDRSGCRKCTKDTG